MASLERSCRTVDIKHGELRAKVAEDTPEHAEGVAGDEVDRRGMGTAVLIDLDQSRLRQTAGKGVKDHNRLEGSIKGRRERKGSEDESGMNREFKVH